MSKNNGNQDEYIESLESSLIKRNSELLEEREKNKTLKAELCRLCKENNSIMACKACKWRNL